MAEDDEEKDKMEMDEQSIKRVEWTRPAQYDEIEAMIAERRNYAGGVSSRSQTDCYVNSWGGTKLGRRRLR